MSKRAIPKLIRDMSHAEVIAAIEASSGRNWRAADFVAVTTFHDCARTEVYWNDGAANYMLHDLPDEAMAHAVELGFRPSAAFTSVEASA